jgi:hypothetical protein
MTRNTPKRSLAWTGVTDRLEQAVLKQIARYRLMTVEALHVWPSCGCPTTRSARRQLERIRQDGLVDRAPLLHRQVYYHLTGLGRAVLEMANGRDNEVGPLSERAKIRALACLNFCCLAPERRQLLFRDELAQFYPPLAQRGRPGGYYLHVMETLPHVGLLRVDAGGAARWDRIVYKLRADATQHRQQSVARQLIEKRQFELSVVTTLPAKALRIREALDGLSEFRDIHVRITAMPVLLQLVAPPPR